MENTNREIDLLLNSERFNHLLSNDVREQIEIYVKQKAAIKASNEKILSNVLIYGDTDEHTVSAGLYLLKKLLEDNPECKKHIVMYGDAEVSNLNILEKPFILLLQPSDLTDKSSLLPRLSYFFDNPECTLIVCSNENKIKEYFDDDRIFYDLLPEHIKISETNIDDVYNRFIDRLSSTPYAPTEEFKTKIKNYISVIYTDARMKENDFVNDLYSRVMRNVYKRNQVSTIEATDIPFSKKYKETFEQPKKVEIETKKTSNTILTPEQSECFKCEKQFSYTEQSKLQDTRGKNILLLAMSSIPNSIKPDLYNMVPKSPKQYLGITQLDTVPKVLGYSLNDKGEALDHIIIIQTNETYDNPNENKETAHRVSYTISDSDGNIIENAENWSAFDAFKSHVHNFINPNTPDEEKYISIPINQNAPTSGLTSAVEKIRDLKNSKASNLYMDVHGGFREVQLLSTALTTLLKNEDINIKDIYTVHPNEKEILFDKSFKVFEFISGMNEFLNYGRSLSLNKFIQVNEAETANDELITLINDISDAMQLCDMSKFDNSLEKLRRYYKTDVSVTTPFLKLFSTQIKSAYGKLLEDHTVLDEIEWCLNNDFIQQALTLIESKMPSDFIVKHNIILYDADGITNGTKDGVATIIPTKHVLVADGKKAWDKDENFVFVEWSRAQFINNRKDPNERYPRVNIKIDNYNYATAEAFPKPVTFSGQYKKNNITAEINIFNPAIHDTELFTKFIQLHLALKDARNNTNHATEKNRIPISCIKRAINNYCEMAKMLLTEVNNSASPNNTLTTSIISTIDAPKNKWGNLIKTIKLPDPKIKYDTKIKKVPFERLIKLIIAYCIDKGISTCQWEQLKEELADEIPEKSMICTEKTSYLKLIEQYYGHIITKTSDSINTNNLTISNDYLSQN